MNKRFLPILGFALVWNNFSLSQDNTWYSGRPDGHAPISIMGDHYHEKGEFMFSYRYMSMWMDGNLSTSNTIANDVLFQNYRVAPQSMRMDMHMLGVMYAPTDYITLMAMGNYTSNTMNLKTRMGMDFTTESMGIGDISVSALIKIMNKNRHSMHANVGTAVPIGDIDQRDDTPMMVNTQLAYPMQLGSGTWDPFVGLTYLGQLERYSWGLQSSYKYRLGENTENYTFGNRLDAIGWTAIKVNDYLSFSTGLSFYNKGKIKGADADLNPMMMPLFNTKNSGRSQLDWGLGTNFYIPSGKLKNLRLGAEFKFPIFQDVNGVQMKNQLVATFGVQYAMGGHK